PYSSRSFGASAAISNALFAAGEVINSNAFFWNTLTASAFLFAFTSALFWKRSNICNAARRSFSRSAEIDAGGNTSGTAKSGAFGSASMTNGAAPAPRYADPVLGCIFGKQTYGGTDSRGPSLLAITDPNAGR